MKLISIDLFSGVGGLTQGLHKAGFQTKLAFEIDEIASKAYKLNHKKTKVYYGRHKKRFYSRSKK
jgi:DNA (cytosine-5)-methyltransferase 1